MKTSEADIKGILESSKIIAVVGCSDNPYRTSNYIAKFLEERGYTIIPVNPMHEEILGHTCYPKLRDIPEEVKVDIVNVFRNSAYTEGVLREVIEWKESRNQSPIVWTQLDVSSAAAERLASEQDITYVKNRCIMVEWERSF